MEKNKISNFGKNILLTEEHIKLLNDRIKAEENSSRIYLAMSMWLNDNGYQGAAKLWKKYSNEELTHADWSRDYLLAMGVQPVTPGLDTPTQTFKGLVEIVELSYEHEIDITKECKELAACSFKEGDHVLYTLASHYLKEQIEEHAKMQDWKDRIDAFGSEPLALRLLDQEMGES